MLDPAFHGADQAPVGDETERFPLFTYGRHVIRVQKVIFNKGYKGKYFILQAETVESTSPADHPVGETRVWMQGMNQATPNAQEAAQGAIVGFAAAGYGYAFPQDKERFDREGRPQINALLEQIMGPTQSLTGQILRLTVSWQVAKGQPDPLMSGFPITRFYPISVPAEATMLISPPPGFKPYVKPGAAPPVGAPQYAPQQYAAAPPPQYQQYAAAPPPAPPPPQYAPQAPPAPPPMPGYAPQAAPPPVGQYPAPPPLPGRR